MAGDGAHPDGQGADIDPARLPVWRQVEDERSLGRSAGRPGALSPDVANVETIQRAWRLVDELRNRGREICASAGREDRFDVEYGVALLYHTLRTIGFDLPIVKRLYAVYCAARLIDFLDDPLSER